MDVLRWYFIFHSDLKDAIINPIALRHKLLLNQEEFWGKIGVSQSGGSRYERDRKMPSAVKELMRLVYVEKVDITKVRGEDIAIINYLKDAYPDLHKTLKKAAKEKSIHIEQDKTRNREVTHGRHSK